MRADLMGQKFNRLTVVGFNRREKKQDYWDCECECGGKRVTSTYSLRHGICRSCGCLKKEGDARKKGKATKRREDLTGKRFGRLTVVSFSHVYKGGIFWSCKCDCGEDHVTSANTLRQGHCKSCGCLSREANIKRRISFGTPDGWKKCSKCLEVRPEAEFHKTKHTYDGLAYQCKQCVRQKQQERNAKRKAAGLQSYVHIELRRLRMDVLVAYSGDPPRCACCGETTYEFLTLDHINGGGDKHRKRVGGSTNVYRELRKQGYPEGYRILCMNCNHAHGHYGFCPHQRKREEIDASLNLSL